MLPEADYRDKVAIENVLAPLAFGSLIALFNLEFLKLEQHNPLLAKLSRYNLVLALALVSKPLTTLTVMILATGT